MSFDFRPLVREDFLLLAQWLAAPHVEMWWRDAYTPDVMEAEYGPVVDGTDASEVSIVEYQDRPIGMIQRYRLRDYPEWEHAVPPGVTPDDAAGIDYLIGEEALIGRGLGGQIIAAYVDDTWDRYPDAAAILVSVQQENRRSWRVLEKADFTRTWAGMLDSDDPSDDGPAYVYVKYRSAQRR